MKSIREFYKIGNGPSSSHTMGPEKATRFFKERYAEADSYEVILYGSLAFTGKGHLTDKIIEKTCAPKPVKITFDQKTECRIHPNTMDLIAYRNGTTIGEWRVYSIGGGSIKIEGEETLEIPDIYPYTFFGRIKEYCNQKRIPLYEYVYENEDSSIKEFLKDVWHTMEYTIREGLTQEGVIPGKLQLPKRAKALLEKQVDNESEEMKSTRLLTAYAYAVSETNASGGIIVTAPTCRSFWSFTCSIILFKREISLYRRRNSKCFSNCSFDREYNKRKCIY